MTPRDEPAERLRREVEALCTPSGRPLGTPGHEAAREHLRGRLEALELEPYAAGFELPYRSDIPDFAGYEFANLVGVAPGERRDEAPVLLGAHYDTAGSWPGADDNAAAVAIALEVAARVRREPAERDLVVALFDAEEPPFFHMEAMGSSHYVAHQMRRRPHVMLALDLVGHAVPLPDAEDAVFVTGMESDPSLERVLNSARALQAPHARVVTALNRYVGIDMSDHHAFRLARVPYLFWTCGRWEHYHQASDTPEKLDYPKMASIADLVERVVRGAGGEPLDGPWEGYDPTPTDLSTMRAVLGPLLERRGMRLESREDIDHAVAMLMELFRL